MKILVLDNYDSFTYNLVHYIENLQKTKVDVFRNDKINIEDIRIYDKIVLSPGPGLPDEAGNMKKIIEEYYQTKSILGICLGMQAIGEVFNCRLYNLEKVYHGVSTDIYQKIEDTVLFRNIPDIFAAGRYHSWVIDKTTVNIELQISSVDIEGNIMSLFHSKFDIRGVQFHPESIMTPLGKVMLDNWLKA